MKKVLIVAVCLALVLTLAFTLGALGKKPEKPPGKPEYVYKLTFEGPDVTGTVHHCGTQGRSISSSRDEEFRPNLCLDLEDEEFGDYNICTSAPYGRYLDLNEDNGKITMQFFFFYKGEKVQLTVYRGKLDGEWLSTNFKIIFNGAEAKITPTKGKKFPPLWHGYLDITIECQGE